MPGDRRRGRGSYASHRSACRTPPSAATSAVLLSPLERNLDFDDFPSRCLFGQLSLLLCLLGVGGLLFATHGIGITDREEKSRQQRKKGRATVQREVRQTKRGLEGGAWGLCTEFRVCPPFLRSAS